jgi:cell cycle sensor histidine kinase DivJ
LSSGETTADWLSGLRLASERLLSTRADGDQPARHVHLLTLLLVAPFVLIVMVIQAITTIAGASTLLAAACALFATSWLLALLLIEKVSASTITLAAFVGGAVVVGGGAGLLGGLASPASCMLVALVLEGYRVTGSRHIAAVAGAGGGAVMVVTWLLAGEAVAASSPWHWLSPVLYAAILSIRWQAGDARTLPASDAPSATFDATRLDAAILGFAPSGEVQSVGGSAQGMFNVDPSLLLGNGFFDRVHVADRVAFLCALSEARQNGRARKVELKVRRATDAQTGEVGGYTSFEIECVRDIGAHATIWAVVRGAGDIAELRGALAHAVEQANATDVAKGRFLATVSHELRTPLNAIIGFSDMLLHREISGDLTCKQAEHVGLIREAGNHLLSVVNAILDVSKIESGSYQIAVEPFELKSAVDLCCAMLEPQASAKGITLSVKMPPRLDRVAGDQRAVQQILLNLLSNAIKFTPDGGSVSVNALAKDGLVRLFVNDTGIGIAADDLAKLGRPFMQVQNDYTRQFQGTGLGLSLVKGLVRLHGGTMSIESAPGMGTTVTIGLPSARQEATKGDVAARNGQGEVNGTALRRIA